MLHLQSVEATLLGISDDEMIYGIYRVRSEGVGLRLAFIGSINHDFPLFVLPSAFALFEWFPTILREPLSASDTLSEATAPVKLPAWHCPTAGLRRLVRSPISQGWYPNSGSAATDVTVSQPPTYPVHATPDPSAKLE